MVGANIWYSTGCLWYCTDYSADASADPADSVILAVGVASALLLGLVQRLRLRPRSGGAHTCLETAARNAQSHYVVSDRRSNVVLYHIVFAELVQGSADTFSTMCCVHELGAAKPVQHELPKPIT